jgi:methylmalonyl-CoA mutase, N-terminal domain
VIVGVNKFQSEEDLAQMKTLKVSPEGEEKQNKRLRQLKKKRNQAVVLAALAKVKGAAENGQNLMPPILEAVKAYATLQEIADQMRTVFGEYKEKIVI